MLDDPLTGGKVSVSETVSDDGKYSYYDENRKTSQTVLNKLYAGWRFGKEFIAKK